MAGALRLETTFVLPPGDDDVVVRRLRLDGQFAIAGPTLHERGHAEEDRRAEPRSRGKTLVEDKERVASQFRGTFKLANGTLTIPEVVFKRRSDSPRT